MSKHDWKSYILLDDAGMLSARKKRALEKALADDLELRAFRDQLQWVRSAAKSSDDETAVSDFAMERIKAEAHHTLRAQQPKRRYGFQLNALAQWRPALIYASISVLLIMVGAMLLVYHPREQPAIHAEAPTVDELFSAEEWDWLFEEEFMELAKHLDRLDMEIETMVWMTNEHQTEEWAQELLQLEGS